MQLSMFHVQVCNLWDLGFQILPPSVLHTVFRLVSQVEKASCVVWFHEVKAVITMQGGYCKMVPMTYWFNNMGYIHISTTR
jgi:hypothetical protein